MNNFGLDQMFKVIKPELKAIVDKYINQDSIDSDSMLDEIISKIKKNM